MRLLYLVFLSTALLSAYTYQAASSGATVHRTDVPNIQFAVNQAVAAGMLNADGLPMIAPGSDPLAALQNAANTWSNIATSRVSFLPLQLTSSVNDPTDHQHVIVFLDTPEIRSLVGSALAVTLDYFTVAAGQIVDSDIVFNPTAAFSTNLAAKTYDLQSVATHELGHSLGASHSGVLSATMFQGVQQQVNSPSALSADDIAFATDAYPAASSAASYGTISGTISLTTGEPVFGALLVAIDPVTGLTVGSISSLSDGTYSLEVPRSSYLLYAEPLSSEVLPQNLYLSNVQVNASFQTAFFGGASSPQLVDVASGLARADIAVLSGAAPFTLQLSGTGTVGGVGDFQIAAGPTLLTGGSSVDLLVYGPGLDAPGAQYDVRLIGPGLTLHPNSVHFDTRTAVNGSRLLRMTVDVASQPSLITGSIVVLSGSAVAALSGSLLVLPAQ